jgi:hypothetical protein
MLAALATLVGISPRRSARSSGARPSPRWVRSGTLGRRCTPRCSTSSRTRRTDGRGHTRARAYARRVRAMTARQDRRARARPRPLRKPGASLYRGAALGRADPGCRHRARADRAHRRRPEPDHATAGLPLPSTLPVCNGDLQHDRAAARSVARPRARGGLPPPTHRHEPYRRAVACLASTLLSPSLSTGFKPPRQVGHQVERAVRDRAVRRWRARSASGSASIL